MLGPSSSYLINQTLGGSGVAARRGQKVQRGQNFKFKLSDHAQLLTTPSFMHMQRIYNFFFFFFLEFQVFNK